MWDNENNQEQTKKRNSQSSRVITMVLLTAVILGILALILFPEELNLDAVKRWFAYLNVKNDGAYGSYTFDSHNSSRYAALEDQLIIGTVGGLYGYDDYGREVLAVQGQMELPFLETEGDFALSYDAAGNTILLGGKKGTLLQLSEPFPVYDADLSSDGAIAFASTASGYKSVLTVYDEDQTLIYRWLSSSTYMPVCAVSEKASWLAGIGLGQADGTFESRLYLFQTTVEEPVGSVSLGNELIYDLNFVKNDLICAVGESSVQFVRTDGTVVGSYSYEGQYLKDHDGGGDGFLALTLNMYKAGNRYTVVTVNDKGEELASLYLGEEIVDLSANGKYLAVLTPEALTIYHCDLKVYSRTTEIAGVTSVAMREDGTAVLIGNGSGKLFIP